MRRTASAHVVSILLCLSLFVHTSQSYKLLFLPLSERTHMLVHLKLATVLAQRGHDVSVITAECHHAFAQKVAAQMAAGALELPAASSTSTSTRDSSSRSGNTTTNKQIRFIPYSSMNCSYHEQEKAAARLLTPLGEVRAIYRNVVGRADALLSDEPLMQQLSALAPSTDLLISDIFSFGMLLAAKLNMSHIDLDVGTSGSLWEPDLYGAEPAASYIPAVGTFLPTTGLNCLQRAANWALTAVIRALIRAAFWHPSSSLQQVVRKHDIPIRWPYTRALMLLVNSNFATEPPRAIPPNIQYVGPILPEPAQNLAQQHPDLARFITESGLAGTVLVSFGGTLQAPLEVSRALVKAMAALHPTRFVWKLSAPDQTELAATTDVRQLSNVYISDWLPQNDLLGHSKVRAFVTQGGYLSMGEAAYHGVPVLGMPFIPGQAELIRFAYDQGRALYISPQQLRQLQRGDVSAFTHSLQALLALNSSYHSAAQVVSRRLKAAQRPYKDLAADWVEYAAAVRNDGAFLHPVKVTQCWYQQAMLDVMFVYAAAAVLVGLVSRQLLRFVGRLVRWPRSSLEAAGSQQLECQSSNSHCEGCSGTDVAVVDRVRKRKATRSGAGVTARVVLRAEQPKQRGACNVS